MNVNIKQRLAGKSAYIALAVLLTAILIFTVIAIIATVNSTEEVTPPPVTDGDGVTPEPSPSPAPDQGQTPTPPPAEDTPSDALPDEPEAVYGVPCEGYVQKDYARDTLVFSQTMNDHRVHLGVDIAGKIGDPVKSFGKGTVERVYSDPFMGKSVVIDHGNGLKSVYMNLSDTLAEGIAVGSTVEVGTVIGAIGETAISECADHPHLHFEVMLDSRRVDPRNYITLPSSADGELEYGE
jgi:murein DD-endopeptidase MepM/ murein hydrolase activator NlpD